MTTCQNTIYHHVDIIEIDGTVCCNKLSLPLVLKPKINNPTSNDRLTFVGDYKNELLKLVNLHGAVLLRGWGKSSNHDFSKITYILNNSNNFNMSCSAGPRIEVSPGVFTANEAPPEDTIPFHHEMAQCDNPPAFVLFFCNTPSLVGGNTPLVSSFQACKFLRDNYPDIAEKLISKGVQYIRVLPKETDLTNALGKSWTDTYKASNKDEMEQIMKKEGTSWSWHGDDFLKTISHRKSTIITHHQGGEVFFAAAETTFKSGNKKIDDCYPSKAICFGDGSDLDDNTVNALFELGKFMDKTCTTWKWESGDVLIIDNATVMHARNDFVPPRKILASLIGNLDLNNGLKYNLM